MIRKTQNTALSVTVGLALAAGAASAQSDMPAGTDADAEYAGLLWEVMQEEDLAGEGMIRTFPYEGIAPHGMMLETLYTTAEVDGHAGALVVKRNYGPEGVSNDEVLADPGTHLGSVTVMFRREEGYDPDNADWFWAKYLPDGTLDQNPAGMRLAGRVGKGADAGCIPCHAGAGGGDYLFTTDAALGTSME
jgi:hypothetical protein